MEACFGGSVNPNQEIEVRARIDTRMGCTVEEARALLAKDSAVASD